MVEEPAMNAVWKMIAASQAAFLFVALAVFLPAQQSGEQPAREWRFAVSGDARNCGDVVMPAIAAAVHQRDAAFYWQLGDFRFIRIIDEDIQHEGIYRTKPLDQAGYLKVAWDDFIANQIVPFGATPVFLGIGNHETISPKTREDWIFQFTHWLDQPALRADAGNRTVRSYFHWTMRGVDFISLDNATHDQFDAAQMAWFRDVLNGDEKDPDVRAIVVGMHEALPESVSSGHSMNESPVGTETGRQVYGELLRARDMHHKRVYLLASHSHYYAENIFDTDYWRHHGGVLPGWIVGTAGAHRYALPAEAESGHQARTDVYGYLLGRVQPDGAIRFDFQEVKEPAVPPDVVARFTQPFVDWCFAANSDSNGAAPPAPTP
jgi:hypothetical protein